MNKNKILIVVNSDWFFLLHMMPIIKSLKGGNEVYVLAPNAGKKEIIASHGFVFLDLYLDRKGINPFKETKTLVQIFRVYKQIKPDIVHHITIKPIIYGSLIARFFGIKTINTVCGLGYSFIEASKKFETALALKGYQFAMQNTNAFHFFENKDDAAFLKTKNILKETNNHRVINGVGANLDFFKPCTKKHNKIVIILASRMLKEKGIVEFVEAAKLLKEKYYDKVAFKLYGKIDNGNPGALSTNYLEGIEIEGYLKWYGFTDNMLTVFKQADVVSLPSYYGEGCPMVLMEACAMGLPVVTTDSVGCRECVVDGANGFKIPVKDTIALKIAFEKLIVSEELRTNFSVASRQLAIEKFDQKKVIQEYQEIYNRFLD